MRDDKRAVSARVPRQRLLRKPTRRSCRITLLCPPPRPHQQAVPLPHCPCTLAAAISTQALCAPRPLSVPSPCPAALSAPVHSMQASTAQARRQSASKHVLKRSARFLCLHRCPPCSVRTTIKKLLRFSVSFRARFL